MVLRPGPVDFKEKWKELEQTINGILRLDKIPRDEWYTRFNDIYAMCGAYPKPHHIELYDSTKSLLEKHVIKLLPMVQTEDTENLLQEYHTQWQNYRKSVNHLNSLYQYFNMMNVSKNNLLELTCQQPDPNEPQHMMIGELGLDIWKCHMVVPLKDSMPKMLLNEVDKSRHNISMTTTLSIIGGILNSFVEVEESNKHSLKLYKSYFEKPFLEKASEYFKFEASKLVKTCTVSQYMVKVLQIMKDEGFRSKTYFHDSTYNKLQLRCRQHMVIDCLSFLRGEFEAIIKEERLDDMHNMYLILRKIKDESMVLAKIFREYVQQHGIKVLKSLKKYQIHVHFIEAVLDLHKKYKTIVIEKFNNDFLFSEALDRAFSVIINYRLVEDQPSKSAEYLSEYCDNLLKKSYKGISEAEIDHKLAQSITIFNYLHDKDIFHRVFQRDLAKRLIFQRTQSIDEEEAMINKLKQASGYEFINKLHRMFTDIRVSEGLNTQFHNEFLKEKKLKKLDFSFSTYVLQTGAWPLTLTTESSFVIPKQLTAYVENFVLFYSEKFNGRKLTWLHHQSQGVLKLNYLPKMYIVTLQMFQMSIMLLFEDCNTLKYSAINDILKLNNDQFQKHINSLIECKLLMLDGDNVTLNMAFTNKRTKFHITSSVQKDLPQDTQHTINSVKDDRKVYLQANITRIMKVRKTLKYTQLVNEIFSQPNTFAPSTVLIKRTIEILIDKGYLSRTPNVSDEYNYVA
ncbi:cullin-2-like [Rhopalosiphum padi]|uniref:cullin-2-like n=1 Tax=Rhopalosiphum padi TaxID=40932 RepID=UPI00298EBACB|nr:cullin-2-like [Rhopalosiphum padi]XP_060845006.1 cullin-2-like [Rhopalosiphum padi]